MKKAISIILATIVLIFCFLGLYHIFTPRFVEVCDGLTIKISSFSQVTASNKDGTTTFLHRGEVIGGIVLYKGTDAIIEQYTQNGITANLRNDLVEMLGESIGIAVTMCGTGNAGEGNVEVSLSDAHGNEILHNLFIFDDASTIYDIWLDSSYDGAFQFVYDKSRT